MDMKLHKELPKHYKEVLCLVKWQWKDRKPEFYWAVGVYSKSEGKWCATWIGDDNGYLLHDGETVVGWVELPKIKHGADGGNIKIEIKGIGGRWISFNWSDNNGICYWGIKCSHCNEKYKYGGEVWLSPKYCPNCGTKMKGEMEVLDGFMCDEEE